MTTPVTISNVRLLLDKKSYAYTATLSCNCSPPRIFQPTTAVSPSDPTSVFIAADTEKTTINFQAIPEPLFVASSNKKGVKENDCSEFEVEWEMTMKKSSDVKKYVKSATVSSTSKTKSYSVVLGAVGSVAFDCTVLTHAIIKERREQKEKKEREAALLLKKKQEEEEARIKKHEEEKKKKIRLLLVEPDRRSGSNSRRNSGLSSSNSESDDEGRAAAEKALRQREEDERARDEDLVTHCHECNAEFGVFTWKHRCEAGCGFIFCDNCTKKRVKKKQLHRHDAGDGAHTHKDDDEEVRACDACAKEESLWSPSCPAKPAVVVPAATTHHGGGGAAAAATAAVKRDSSSSAFDRIEAADRARDEDLVTHCQLCKAEFGVFTWKHRCEAGCRKIVCDNCSKARIHPFSAAVVVVAGPAAAASTTHNSTKQQKEQQQEQQQQQQEHHQKEEEVRACDVCAKEHEAMLKKFRKEKEEVDNRKHLEEDARAKQQPPKQQAGGEQQLKNKAAAAATTTTQQQQSAGTIEQQKAEKAKQKQAEEEALKRRRAARAAHIATLKSKRDKELHDFKTAKANLDAAQRALSQKEADTEKLYAQVLGTKNGVKAAKEAVAAAWRDLTAASMAVDDFQRERDRAKAEVEHLVTEIESAKRRLVAVENTKRESSQVELEEARRLVIECDVLGTVLPARQQQEQQQKKQQQQQQESKTDSTQDNNNSSGSAVASASDNKPSATVEVLSGGRSSPKSSPRVIPAAAETQQQQQQVQSQDPADLAAAAANSAAAQLPRRIDGSVPCQRSSLRVITRGSPAWQRDDDAPQCKLCKTRFTFTTRRHHCRCCGCVFCSKCSDKKITFPDNTTRSERACKTCADLTMKWAQAQRKLRLARGIARTAEGNGIEEGDQHDCNNGNNYNNNPGHHHHHHHNASICGCGVGDDSDDDEFETCNGCHLPFGFFRPREGCNYCGVLHCRECLNCELKVTITTTKVVDKKNSQQQKQKQTYQTTKEEVKALQGCCFICEQKLDVLPRAVEALAQCQKLVEAEEVIMVELAREISENTKRHQQLVAAAVEQEQANADKMNELVAQRDAAQKIVDSKSETVVEMQGQLKELELSARKMRGDGLLPFPKDVAAAMREVPKHQKLFEEAKKALEDAQESSEDD